MMETQVETGSTTHEEVINRVKALPVEVLPSLMDYAAFLESRYLSEDALWQATTDQYRDALRARADEALEAHRAGPAPGAASVISAQSRAIGGRS